MRQGIAGQRLFGACSSNLNLELCVLQVWPQGTTSQSIKKTHLPLKCWALGYAINLSWALGYAIKLSWALGYAIKLSCMVRPLLTLYDNIHISTVFKKDNYGQYATFYSSVMINN